MWAPSLWAYLYVPTGNCWVSLWLSAYPRLCEHVCVTMAVCVSWIWWRRPCVTPCGYVIESVNILEREQRVVVFVCQHYSFLQLSGSGWVTLSLLSVCSCDSILGKQHRRDRIFSCAFCANACNESSFPLLLSSTLSSGNVESWVNAYSLSKHQTTEPHPQPIPVSLSIYINFLRQFSHSSNWSQTCYMAKTDLEVLVL